MDNLVMVQTPNCIMCGGSAFIEVREDELDRFANGALVQDAFRTLDAAQRELIATGTHEHCWQRMSDMLDGE